jgi:hypothetical protein
MPAKLWAMQYSVCSVIRAYFARVDLYLEQMNVEPSEEPGVQNRCDRVSKILCRLSYFSLHQAFPFVFQQFVLMISGPV